MPTYETLFITLPNLTEDEEQAAIGGLSSVVGELGGTMVVNERMGRRRLAYNIKDFEDGVYTRLLYDSEAAVPHELDRRLRISDKVLRHMTVRLEPDWAEAAKVQAVRDAEARAEAEARADAEAKAAAERAEAAGTGDAEADGSVEATDTAPAADEDENDG